jgi:hypothetical protein
MADYGRVAALDIALINETTARGRVAALDIAVIGETTPRGRVAALDLALIGETTPRGRVAVLNTMVIWHWDTPAAVVPDIIGHPFVPATFDATGSTGSSGNAASITNRLWSWTSVPPGSAIANLSNPMPDNGGAGFISMANNAVLYHCEGNGIDSSPVVPPSPAPMPDNGGTTFIAMTNNAVLYHCEGSGADSSGNGNTATFSNVTTGAAGKIGTNAWSFDTVTAVASVTTDLVCTGDYSFAFWFYDLEAAPIGRTALHSAVGQFIPIYTQFNVLGLWNGSFQSSGFTMLAASYAGWHHFAAVASAGRTDYYVDGQFVGFVPVKLTNAQKYIGNQNGASQRFAARMDEVAFWERALSAAEIEALWLNQVGTITGNTATFSNVTTGAAGKVGSFAWSFDTDAGVAIMTSGVPLGANWTIAFWFYDLDPDTDYRVGCVDVGPTMYPIIIVPTTNLLGSWDGTLKSSGFAMPAASYTGWHHMCAVGSGTTTAFYVDGVYRGTAPIKATQTMKYLGNQLGLTLRFAKRIDEYAVWTRAFTDTEVLTLYANQSGNYAGVGGATLPFTPDVVGTYTIQYSQRDTNVASTYTDTAEVLVTSPVAGVWPQGMLREYPFIQGSRLNARRGQL